MPCSIEQVPERIDKREDAHSSLVVSKACLAGRCWAPPAHEEAYADRHRDAPGRGVSLCGSHWPAEVATLPQAPDPRGLQAFAAGGRPVRISIMRFDCGRDK